MNIEQRETNLTLWQQLSDIVETNKSSEPVKIVIAGKYTGLLDSYLSLSKALEHASNHANCKLDVTFIDVTTLEEDKWESENELFEANWNKVKSAHGIIVPGGFGDRGN